MKATRAVTWKASRVSLGLVAGAVGFVGCTSEAGKGTGPGDERVPPVTIHSVQSWDVCVLAGPGAGIPGVYGADLGISTEEPPVDGAPASHLRVLFGDTWPSDTSVCDYPPPEGDDLLATIPRERPVSLGGDPPESVDGCGFLRKLPASPEAFAPITLRERGPEGRTLTMGYGRTPLAAFTDGEHRIALFTRGSPTRCDVTADCPATTYCTTDPSYPGKPLGACSPSLGIPDPDSPNLCLDDAACGTVRRCLPVSPGVCVSQDPLFVQGPDGPVSPPWYRDDPRAGLLFDTFAAVAADAENPHVYTVGAVYPSHYFVNVTARAVAHFDPENPDRNDYRPGHHTLLLWGRPDFSSRRGKHAPLYLAYQPLEGFVRDDGTLAWSPRFFAGFGEDGRPTWALHEHEARGVYGTDVTVTEDSVGALVFDWHDPEFDVTMQHTLSFVEPLRRWVMLYGGSVAPWLRFDVATNRELPAFFEQPSPGAIHYRQAVHPWGKAAADAPDTEAWSAPLPLATPADLAPHLGCGESQPALDGCTAEADPHRPLQLVLSLAEHPDLTEADYPEVTRECLDGTAGQSLQYDLSGDTKGNLYAPALVDSWTADVTDSVSDLAAGERVAEIYWNVSTWNPYKVVLVKSRLRARP